MTGLRTDEFDFPFDERLIAQQPLSRRDQSRLMRLTRPGGTVAHHGFGELPDLLRPGDVLVLNDTRVIPARFFARRPTGGRIEGLFLHEPAAGAWSVMLKGADRCGLGERLSVEGSDVRLELREKHGAGHWTLAVEPARPAMEILDQCGTTPLPPYIRRSQQIDAGTRRRGDAERDVGRYQTIYAARPGAVAAPTAGLHFTPEIFEALSLRGIETVRVTLHVGAGTFLPVKAGEVSAHTMHAEWFDLPAATAEQLQAARAAGRRIVAVGTTAVRVLETVAAMQTDAGTRGRGDAGTAEPCGEGVPPSRLAGVPPASGEGDLASSSDQTHGTHNAGETPVSRFRASSGWTRIFIHPPYAFRAVDALITNFHLPRSTLFMLVSAFGTPGSTDGIAMLRDAYAQAVAQQYRFFSYGDAMLIE